MSVPKIGTDFFFLVVYYNPFFDGELCNKVLKEALLLLLLFLAWKNSDTDKNVQMEKMLLQNFR